MNAPMTRKIIRIDGSEEPLERPLALREIMTRISAPQALDIVQLRHLGRPLWVMVVDDTGMSDGRELNAKATALYHANCYPGTTHCIHGDVAIILDGDDA